MTGGERRDVMDSMSANAGGQDEPQVGIFWYDSGAGDLFGVSKTYAGDLPFNSKGIKTERTLHKKWWDKQRFSAKSRGKPLGVFAADYTEIPRGRILQREDSTFRMMCGSWVRDVGQAFIEDLVKDEFNLRGVPFETVIDTHWDIGHGWSQDFFDKLD